MGELFRERADRLAAELAEARRHIVALENAAAAPGFAQQLTDALLDGFSLLSPRACTLR
jgi:hypothetical protein